MDRLLFGPRGCHSPHVPLADVHSRPACRAAVRAAGPEPKQGFCPQAQPGPEQSRAAAAAAAQLCSPASRCLLLRSGWLCALQSLWNLCPLPLALSLILFVLCVSGLVPSVVHQVSELLSVDFLPLSLSLFLSSLHCKTRPLY